MTEIVNCECDRHGEAILEIFNQAIATSTALYEYELRTFEFIQNWFSQKQADDYPIIGIEANNTLVGFATYDRFRSLAAYQYTIEHSIYIDLAYRGQGLGKRLLQQLIAIASAQEYHLMIGVIDSLNQASIQLHRSFGFKHCGKIEQAGFKFNRWLDLELYQLILDSGSQSASHSQLNY